MKKSTPLPDATLVAQLKAREAEQQTLLCLSGKIAAARTREDLWDIINEQVLNLFGGKYYTLCLLDESTSTHSPFLYSREYPEFTKASFTFLHEATVPSDPILNATLKAATPLIFRTAELLKDKTAPAHIRSWTKLGIKAVLAIKIENGNQHKGVLQFYARADDTFGTAQFSLLNGIADQLATGICNVLANEKMQQQLEEINRYKQQLEEENFYLQEAHKHQHSFSELIGTSEAMQKIFKLIGQVAPSDTTVLILGETGTGKELIARAIHNASPRKEKMMIKVNCAAIPASLIESELFGHEKGAFTGALERRIGKFELAHNSTLFLDEIGELPIDLQVKLLRALQEREIERVGGRNTIKINVRIIAATNRDLEQEVSQGRFRSDLFYRLHVFPVTLPPLRNRKEDIPLLAAHFISRYGRSIGKKITGIAQKAMKALMDYSWPGNIRELEHFIERTILLTESTKIKEVILPVAGKARTLLPDDEFVIRPLDDIEREYILKVVRLCNGRISGPQGAALKLDMPSTTLISRMQKLGIKKEHFIAS